LRLSPKKFASRAKPFTQTGYLRVLIAQASGCTALSQTSADYDYGLPNSWRIERIIAIRS
jgi:hypothetical protein